MNRVYTLYRVSTKQQVDKAKDDIPMQREACHEFAEKMGWTIGKEFLEKGISGFKVSASNRDAIQDLKAAALNKEFDILLVFMFDRIGRIDDETPFIVEWFVKQGIRVWSVQEGEQRFESHVDKLMNYIRFWQASGESEKTSMRIKTRMQQLKAEGCYTGGQVPYGYQLTDTGRVNKRGRPVHDLAIDPVQADWIREIFSLTIHEGYGSFRCAEYLNNKGIRTHSGTKFQCNTIIRILKNRIYIGYMSNNEDAPKLKELQMIDDHTFEQVQNILAQRAVTNDVKREVARNTKTRLLLSGIMYCGHCGGALSTMNHNEKHTRKDGTVVTKSEPRYVCYHKNRKLCNCDGQTAYLVRKVDTVVLEVVNEMFRHIKESPDEAVLKKNFDKDMRSCKAKKTKFNLELSKQKKQLDKLEDEVAASLVGESAYSPEILGRSIKKVEEKITELNEALKTLDDEMTDRKRSMENVKPMYDTFKGWAEEFNENISMERKKMIVSQLLSRIEVYKGYDIRIELNMDYKQFCDDWEKINKTSTINESKVFKNDFLIPLH